MSPNCRIGFDLGRTIVVGENGVKVALPDSIAVITRLVKACDGQGFIISKVTPVQELRAKKWLQNTDFYATTGISPEHVHFCAERADKAPIAQRLGLTHFIDDRPEVLAHMENIVRYRILFQGNENDFIAHRVKLLDIYRAQSWREIEKLLF